MPQSPGVGISANLKFRIGQTVVLSEAGKKAGICRRARQGVVVDVNRSLTAFVMVKPEGYKLAQDYPVDFWEPAGRVCPNCGGTGHLPELRKEQNDGEAKGTHSTENT